MESTLPPLPRTYDDVTVFRLEPLHDPFVARELEQSRFTRTQEAEWFARIARDVRRNERAVRAFFPFVSSHSTRHLHTFKTDAAKRWLKAISLSTKRDFCNFVLPLTDEDFQLFVQFFWLIKADERPKAIQLLVDRRRQWGLESWFYEYNFNAFLESGDATAFYDAWIPYWMGQAPRFTGKGVSGISVLLGSMPVKGRQLTSPLLRRSHAKPSMPNDASGILNHPHLQSLNVMSPPHPALRRSVG
jgi:hypothetical protein